MTSHLCVRGWKLMEWKDKKSYVIHIQALNQVLQHRLRLDRIHRAIEFDQSPWLQTHIGFNTKLRTAATNDLEKDFFKLMNNSVFGKTMENIRKHRNIKLVTTEEKYLCTVITPNFKSGVLFGENLMGCEMGKIKVVMNKPVYLGQVILSCLNSYYTFFICSHFSFFLKICCFLHWIQSVNPHFYVTLYYNGCPCICTRSQQDHNV